RWRRRELRLDLLFLFGQQLVWGTVAASALFALRQALSGTALEAIRAIFSRQPMILQVVEVVVAGDLVVYWWHRANHAVPFPCRSHPVHHSAESLDWIAAFREPPFDGLGVQLAQNLPLLLVGLPLPAIAGLVTFRGAWAIWVHSNTRIELGPLEL